MLDDPMLIQYQKTYQLFLENLTYAEDFVYWAFPLKIPFSSLFPFS